jgi:hypothetical protein
LPISIGRGIDRIERHQLAHPTTTNNQKVETKKREREKDRTGKLDLPTGRRKQKMRHKLQRDVKHEKCVSG